MSGALAVELEAVAFERVAADLAVIGWFRDERPLRGGAGRADWRLCGWVSELLRQERVSGEPGERVLLPSRGRLGAPLVLAVGLGARVDFDAGALRDAIEHAFARAAALGVSSVGLDLPGLGAGLAPDAAAQALLTGASRGLAGRGPALLVRVVTPPGRVRLLAAAVEHAARSWSASRVSVRRPARGPSPGQAARRQGEQRPRASDARSRSPGP